MNFILRVVCTSYLTSCASASSELNMMFIQRAKLNIHSVFLSHIIFIANLYAILIGTIL